MEGVSTSRREKRGATPRENAFTHATGCRRVGLKMGQWSAQLCLFRPRRGGVAECELMVPIPTKTRGSLSQFFGRVTSSRSVLLQVWSTTSGRTRLLFWSERWFAMKTSTANLSFMRDTHRLWTSKVDGATPALFITHSLRNFQIKYALSDIKIR